MPGVQANIRLDRTVKQRAEEAFSLAGYDPCEAVRSFWTYASQCLDDPDRLAKTLRELSPDTPPVADRLNVVARIEALPRSLDTMCAQMGIFLAAPGETEYCIDDDALLEDALFERMRERSLL